MKTISYYISMVVILAATIFTGCTDDDEKSLSPRAGELSIYDFAPNTGKGGTQLLINGEQFPLDATSISVSINEVQLSILRSNEEQLLVEVPDNEAIGTAPIVIKTNGKTTQSEVNFIFQKTAITGYSPAYGKVAGRSSSGAAAFLRTVCLCWQTGASSPGRCSPLRCRRKGTA